MNILRFFRQGKYPMPHIQLSRLFSVQKVKLRQWADLSTDTLHCSGGGGGTLWTTFSAGKEKKQTVGIFLLQSAATGETGESDLGPYCPAQTYTHIHTQTHAHPPPPPTFLQSLYLLSYPPSSSPSITHFFSSLFVFPSYPPFLFPHSLLLHYLPLTPFIPPLSFLKGTVSRDFLLLVFSWISSPPPSPRVSY